MSKRTTQNQLNAVRTRKLLTQQELAKRSGVSQVTISHIETGSNKPMALTKEKLAQALETPVEEVFPS